jgi:GWxTD domain-containing protein
MYDRLDGDERRCYDGLHCLMNEFQMRQYLMLGTRGERDEWIDRFWKMLDPTPATKENENRTEHEERCRKAQARYPKEGFPGYDHRGETLIRFGEPDWIDEVPPRLAEAESNIERFYLKMPGEVWHYGKLRMVVPFEEVNLNGECTYYMALKTIGRQEAEGFARRTGGNIFSSDLFGPLTENNIYSPGNISELSFASTDELVRFYDHIDNNRHFHTADIDRDQLECYFDLTSFRGGGNELRAELNFEVPIRELVLEKKGAAHNSKIEVRVVAFDIDMNEVASSSEEVDILLPESVPWSSRSLIPAQFTLSLPPGYYRFGLEVRDLKSKKHGCYRMTRMLESLEGKPCMSDIQFASAIGSAMDGGAFVKGPLRVVPHPLHAYKRPDPLKCYFEIYGLDIDTEGRAFYSIEYSIEPMEKRRWGPVLLDEDVAISSRFETSGYGSTQYQHIEIDTGELWKGAFRLKIKVMDRRTRESTSREARFSILETS